MVPEAGGRGRQPSAVPVLSTAAPMQVNIFKKKKKSLYTKPGLKFDKTSETGRSRPVIRRIRIQRSHFGNLAIKNNHLGNVSDGTRCNGESATSRFLRSLSANRRPLSDQITSHS
ncbi:hypothetical protein GDO81_028111 [Engystomops pustulosus]|uniref:Uncharacterized protein n=1 Tax=Engystomops pustulosus TaxID=76066 RepID=A0AAV6YKA7_ENGPU|nr:hypothetical protein GDO81_028111 [Engystomops pustulosus]